MLIKIIFFVLLGTLLYEFLLFPLILFLLGILKKKWDFSGINYEPSASIIIITRNSEKFIEKRIQNIIEQDYPKDKLEIIVIADKSNDGTGDILRTLKGIEYFVSPERRGKIPLLNKAIEISTNDIIILSDDNVSFEKNAVHELLKGFYYNDVHGVSGVFSVKSKIISEIFYQWFENSIKKAEGKYGVVIGAYGPIYAIRKKYFEKVPENKLLMEDFIITLNTLKKKGKFILAERALCYEEYNINPRNDLLRKKRIGVGNANSLSFIFDLMKRRKNLLLWFLIFSHKLLRWFTAPLLVLVLLFNMLIPYNGLDFYGIFFLAQVAIYLTGIILFLLKSKYANFILGYFFLFWGFLVSKEEKSKTFWDV